MTLALPFLPVHDLYLYTTALICAKTPVGLPTKCQSQREMILP